MNDIQRDCLLAALRANKLAVISSISDDSNVPQSALVAYAEDENFTIYFQTRKDTRKAKNLVKNDKVSLVIGWDFGDLITIQAEGKVCKVTEETLLRGIKQFFLTKESPSTQEYLDHPDTEFYKISLTWVRYSDYRQYTIWETSI